MKKQVCTNENQLCDDDRCRCGETEPVLLDAGEIEMLAQILRNQIRFLDEYPGRFRRFGSNVAVKAKLSEILGKIKA